MNILNLLQQDGILAEHASRGEWHSPCPFCGGTDRFSCWPEKINSSGRYGGGRGCCRGCQWSGDGIAYLQKRKGLTFMQAVKHLGVDAGPMPEKIIRVWTPAMAKTLPDVLWKSKAETFIIACQEQLQGNTEALSWLHDERGLSDETIRASRLGLNPKDLYLDRESWGLSPVINPETGKAKRLWIPKGLCIPNDGTRIRIRRSEPPAKGNKYIVCSGSNMQPMALWADQKTVMIVESELDCLLINQEAGELVGTVALGSAAIKPDAELHNRLMKAKMVLCSLDADVPGANAVGFWKQYRGFKRWPVIRGKDATEQMKAGIAVKLWIEAGL